jgi:arginine N-succinyltransferase
LGTDNGESFKPVSFVLRAASTEETDALYALALITGGGFTNLPADKDALRKKLSRAGAAFARKGDGVEDELYFFVLEDTSTRQIIGSCLIFSRVGDKWPFFSYRINSEAQHNVHIGKTVRHQILVPTNDMDGATEVGGLFLHPKSRADGLGSLLARGRYLFMHSHRGRFADKTFADLRGFSTENGVSPFWDVIGHHFFDMAYPDADTFNGIHGNQFIADLMPKYPVYLSMLPNAAKAVIGIPHPTGRAAMGMLEREGFCWDNYIDIFDAGPTMTARTDDIATVRYAQISLVIETHSIAKHGEDRAGANAEKHLVAAGRLADFRLSHGFVIQTADGISLDQNCATALNISVGDNVTHIKCW